MSKEHDNKFYEFLVKHNLQDVIVKVDDDLWVYKGLGYDNNKFYIHNMALSLESLLMKIYAAAKEDGEKESMRLAAIRFQSLFTHIKDTY